jgi:hypothetical protein
MYRGIRWGRPLRHEEKRSKVKRGRSDSEMLLFASKYHGKSDYACFSPKSPNAGDTRPRGMLSGETGHGSRIADS